MKLFDTPRIEDGCLSVALNGEIDSHAAGQLRAAFALVVRDEQVINLHINMRGVTLMDSSGIGLLVGWYRTVSGRGGRVYLDDVQPVVARVLGISGMRSILHIKEVA
ncbi:MAG: STAS domain-containing protein [Clostridia bacterium]|nr:STAS domain-containing protein [Clostridia bacterium]